MMQEDTLPTFRGEVEYAGKTNCSVKVIPFSSLHAVRQVDTESAPNLLSRNRSTKISMTPVLEKSIDEASPRSMEDDVSMKKINELRPDVAAIGVRAPSAARSLP